MGAIFDTMTQFFSEDNWRFEQLEDQPILRLGFSGDHGKWTCYAQAREEHQQFVFYSVCPLNAPEEKRLATAEFLTRANYGLVIGNFEMDFADGEIRYKTSIDVEDDRLVPALVRNLVHVNVLMMDRYLPGMMAVIYGGRSPAEAIAQIEG